MGAGEWTDDTQMALLEAESLLARGGLDEAGMFDRFDNHLLSLDTRPHGSYTGA